MKRSPHPVDLDEDELPRAVFPPTYRLVFYCFLIGVLGAVAALLFDGAVNLAQTLLLEGIGRYRPPAPGVFSRSP